MTSSACKGLDAFDFEEEDGLTEIVARKFSAKFENPKSDENARTKHKFTAAVAHGNVISKKGSENIVAVDLEEIDCDQNSKNVNSGALRLSYSENVNNECDKHGKDTRSGSPLPSYAENMTTEDRFSRDVFYEEEMELPSPSARLGQSDHALSDSSCSIELTDEDLGDEKMMEEYAVSNSESDSWEDDDSPNDHVSNCCSSGSEMLQDDMDESIVVTCDYIIYQGNYHSALLVMFSPAGIKIHSSDECGTKGMFDIWWKIDDIVSVKCQWFSRVGQALISLSLLSKDAVHGHNVSEIVEAKLALADPHWPSRRQKIMALNSRYMAVWNHSPRIDANEDETSSAAPVPYFPNFVQSFEEVVYPKGDPDAVSINKRDVDLLQPQTFLNDNIIDFYAKYLKNQIAPVNSQRFHFFNSFFFRKLADLDRDPSLAADGKAAFMRVRKWTRKVDIFGKDYIFIPVNFNLHWSLLVICHPGEVAGFKDEDLDKSPKVPCILHMDSIKGTHAGLKNLIQSYLWEEWRERQEEVSEDVSSKFLNLRFVPLELPQQENCFDCGLFLLHYLELFLAEAPVDFNPFKITKHSNFLNVNWFPPLEASLKRTMLQKLIFELLDHRSREVSPSADYDENLLSTFPKNIHNGNGMEFLSKGPDSTVACEETLPDSHVGKGIEISLLGQSSLGRSLSVNKSGLVLREFFGPGAPVGSGPAQFQSFEHPTAYFSALSPIEEGAENFAHPNYTEFGETAEIAPQACDDSDACGSFGSEIIFNSRISDQARCKFTSPESLKLNSDNPKRRAIVEVYSDGEDINNSQEMNIEQRSFPVRCIPSPITGHDYNSSAQAEGSPHKGSNSPDSVHTSAENSPWQENISKTSKPECDRVGKRVYEDFIECDTVSGDVELFGDDVVCERQEQQGLKKLRLAAPEEVKEFE